MTSSVPAAAPVAALLTVPIVHAVTDDEVLAWPGFARAAEAVMAALGPRGAVHLRASLMAARDLHALAARLAAAQRRTGCWLVINERLDVAMAAGALGAQLTRRSVPLADARRVAPALALGASVHDAEEAAAAAREGATWLVVGHVHATASHPGEPGRGVALVTEAARAGPPVIAIGGVRPEHVAALRAAGAHGVAAIRGIWGGAGIGGAEHAERAAAEYLSPHDVSV